MLLCITGVSVECFDYAKSKNTTKSSLVMLTLPFIIVISKAFYHCIYQIMLILDSSVV